MKKLEYTIDIAATPEKVWQTMLDPESYKLWTQVSWPGSFYKGKWEAGEELQFITSDGSGILARVNAIQPFKLVQAEHIAILLEGGKRDVDSDLARDFIGIKEEYYFDQIEGLTRLTVNIVTNPKWEEMFNEGWPGALKRLKELSEE